MSDEEVLVEKGTPEKDTVSDVLEDIILMGVGMFDVVATTHQASEEAIDAYNRLSDRIGHEGKNNPFRQTSG